MNKKARLFAIVCTVLSWTAAADTRVRFVSSNLTSGTQQSYDPGHGLRILQGLCNVPYAVVIGMQEFNYGDNSDDALQEFAEKACGEGATFYREESDSQIPNGFIIKGLPILEKGYWVDKVTTNRGFAWIKLGLPVGQHFYAYSVHFSTRSPKNRQRQALALATLTDMHVPRGQGRILMGDLNTNSTDESAWDILRSATYVDNHVPVDSKNRSATNTARKKKRYDVVLANDTLDRWQAPLDLRGSPKEKIRERVNYFPDGLVLDTQDFPNVERVFRPARKSDSQAPHFQHHPAVQEYVFPERDACVPALQQAGEAAAYYRHAQ